MAAAFIGPVGMVGFAGCEPNQIMLAVVHRQEHLICLHMRQQQQIPQGILVNQYHVVSKVSMLACLSLLPQSEHVGLCMRCRKGREPSWLAQAVPKPWPMIAGTTLVMGDASGPNPTHALNLNFYHMYRWMQKVNNGSNGRIATALVPCS